MSAYNNLRQDSPIATVEFSPVQQGNFSFFHLRQTGAQDDVKRWLTENLGQQIVAETKLHNEQILVVRGGLTQDEILQRLGSRGENFTHPDKERAINAWKWRGNLSMVGQFLQLASSVLTLKPKQNTPASSFKISDYDKGKGIDVPTATFALSNIAANTTNIAFGAEKSRDPHHLRYMKEEFNKRLLKFLPENQAAPSINENRAPLRDDKRHVPKTTGERTHDFMSRHSVSFGEIGLRYFGAINLAFPFRKWKAGAQELMAGDPKKALKTAYNSEDKFTARAGVAYILGKAIALFSKVPDPYNPKPHTWVDTVREKVTFRLSTATEFVAACIIAADRFTKRRIKMPDWKILPQKLRGSVQRDYVGGVGGALFAAAFIIRFFAKFGVKEMNMDDLNAHITEGLSRVPRDKLPQALADTAAFIEAHFDKEHKDKAQGFGYIFTHLANDLYRYHNIALPGAGAPPELYAGGTPQHESSFSARVPRRENPAAQAPAASLAEREAQRAKDGAALGLSA